MFEVQNYFSLSHFSGTLPPAFVDQITQLEQEIRKLRCALNEAVKMNVFLKEQITSFRREPCKQAGTESTNHILCFSSPPLAEFSKTFQKFYQQADSKQKVADQNRNIFLPKITKKV